MTTTETTSGAGRTAASCSRRGSKFILKRIRKFLKAYPEHRQMLCVLVTWILIKKYSCSLRGMVEECEARPGLCRKLDLDHVPSKSWLHKWMKRIPLDLLDSLLLLTAGSGSRRDAVGRLHPVHVQPVCRGGGCPPRQTPHLCIRRPRVAGLSRVLLPTDSRSIVPYLNIMLSLPLCVIPKVVRAWSTTVRICRLPAKYVMK